MPLLSVPQFGPLAKQVQFDPFSAAQQQQEFRGQSLLNQARQMELGRAKAMQGLTFAPDGQLTPEAAQRYAAADPMGYQKYLQDQQDRTITRKREGAAAFGRIAAPYAGQSREEQEAAIPGILSSLPGMGFQSPEGVNADNLVNYVFGAVPVEKQLWKPNDGPKVGTFEDFVTKAYGANPTPQQMLDARKKWETVDNVNGGGGGAGGKLGSFEDYVVRAYGNNPTPQQMLSAREEWETASTFGKKAITEKDKIAAKRAYRYSTMNMNSLEKDLDKVRKMPLWKVAGVYGSNLPSLSGEEAAATYSALTALKSRLANIAIQNMREASKTGGAVGQVTEREWGFLAQSIANIDPDKQTVLELYRNLSGVVDFIKDSKSMQQKNYRDVVGEDPEDAGAPAPGGGTSGSGGQSPGGRSWKKKGG